ncbi:MAG: EpsG family protein [Bacilli bacterium]
MIIYFAIMIVLSILYYYQRNNKKLYVISSFCILATVAAIRSVSVGADTQQFCDVYTSIGNNSWAYFNYISGFGGRIEPGFFLLCKLLSYITRNPQLLIAVTAIFSIGTYSYYIYRESKNPYLSFVIFIGIQQYAIYLTAMRQVLAISILIIGYELFLKKDKTIQYILMVILAMQFHNSAFIGLAYILIKKINFSTKTMLILLFGTVVASLVLPKLLMIVTKYIGFSEYLGSEFFVSNYFAALMQLALYGIFFAIALFYNNFANYDDKFVLYMLLLNVLLEIMGVQIVIVERVIMYFSILSISLVPNCFEYEIDYYPKKFLQIGVVVLSIIYCFIVLYYRPEWTKVVPYIPFF